MGSCITTCSSSLEQSSWEKGCKFTRMGQMDCCGDYTQCVYCVVWLCYMSNSKILPQDGFFFRPCYKCPKPIFDHFIFLQFLIKEFFYPFSSFVIIVVEFFHPLFCKVVDQIRVLMTIDDQPFCPKPFGLLLYKQMVLHHIEKTPKQFQYKY